MAKKKSIKSWLAKQAGIISLAMSNVEKNAFSQSSEGLNSDINTVQRHTKGQLMDSLINGEITQEVMDLRSRMYNMLEAADAYTTKIVGYDDDGMPITETRLKNKGNELVNVKVEPSDLNVLEFVVKNYDIALSIKESIDMGDKLKINAHKPIKLIKNSIQKFDLEQFIVKMHVRNISDTEKLLDIYVSKYPNEDNRTSRLFVSEMKKALDNPRILNAIDFSGLEFITDNHNVIGVDNNLEFKYEILSFDKVVEYNGFYVLKYKAKPIINGENIFAKYRQEEFDKKYENKEARIKK